MGAEDRRRPFAAADDAGHARRHDPRHAVLLGQNPVIGGSNSRLIERGLANLEWMVVRDITETETAAFWHSGQLVRKGELTTEEIKTEVFLMPATLAGEKAGTFTNTHRLMQWHDKVVDAPGDNRSELWFVYHLGRRLKELYADSTDPKDAPIQNLTWDYPLEDARGEPAAEAVLKEMNGYTVADGKQIGSFQELKDDGSTACGAWLYCGVFPEEDTNKARSRMPDGPDGPGTHLDWAFAWPANRRNMYNRASADAAGRALVRAQEADVVGRRQGQVGRHRRRSTSRPTKPPDYQPDWSKKPQGMDALDGRSAFIMIADGRASLFVPSGLKDGPLPTHYEPVESPVKNALYGQQDNPVAKKWERERQPLPRGRRPALSLCADHLSADRASLRRDADALGAGHRRAAAGGLRRNSARARAGARHRDARLGRAVDGARRGRDPRAGHRAAAALRDRRPDASTRSACPGISAGRATPPATSPMR